MAGTYDSVSAGEEAAPEASAEADGAAAAEKPAEEGASGEGGEEGDAKEGEGEDGAEEEAPAGGDADGGEEEEGEKEIVVPEMTEVPGMRHSHGMAAVEGVMYCFGGITRIDGKEWPNNNVSQSLSLLAYGPAGCVISLHAVL